MQYDLFRNQVLVDFLILIMLLRILTLLGTVSGVKFCRDSPPTFLEFLDDLKIHDQDTWVFNGIFEFRYKDTDKMVNITEKIKE